VGDGAFHLSYFLSLFQKVIFITISKTAHVFDLQGPAYCVDNFRTYCVNHNTPNTVGVNNVIPYVVLYVASV
jgi:hypothetical protein